MLAMSSTIETISHTTVDVKHENFINSVVTGSFSIQETRKTPNSWYRLLLKQKATEIRGESGVVFQLLGLADSKGY